MIRRNYIEPEVFKTPVSTSGIFMASTYDSGNNGEGNDPNMSGNTGDLDDDDEAGANSWFGDWDNPTVDPWSDWDS